MVKVVKLAVEGELESGYAVELVDIREDGKPTSIEGGVIGQLPPAIEIYRDYLAWKERYEQLCNLHQQSFRGLRKRNSAVKLPTEISQRSRSECRRECQAAANRLKANFKEWLESREFRKVLDKVQIHLNPQDNIRVLIQTEDLNLWKFPWSEWNLFENYHRGEVCFSPSEFRGIEEPLATRRRKDVNILAVFGDSSGINLDKDEKTIKGLRSVGAEPQPMKEPGVKQFRDRLREKQWDILFFSGHGNSEDREEKIRLNGEEWVTPERMKSDLKEAIGNGLKIAILNSCLGLGFARQVVSEFHLPIAIAMREKVPNEFAQTFLEYVLIEYAQKGEPLYVAVRKARERLADDWRDRLPGVEWLPVTCMNPATRPPTWADLHRPVALREVAFASLLCTTLVMVARFMGLLQPLELAAYDHLMRMRPDEGPDDRIVIVEVTDSDIKELREDVISDGTLLQVLKKVNQYQPAYIGLDIYRDIEQNPGHAELMDYLQTSNNVIAVCKTPSDDDPEGIPPPLNFPKPRLGFTDIMTDPIDDVVRRHLLSMTAAKNHSCTTEYAFSFLLALYFLDSKGYEYNLNSENWQIGDVVLPRLKKHTGGYQQENPEKGYQIILNYRSPKKSVNNVPKKSVDNLTNHRVNIQTIIQSDRYSNELEKLFKDRIVLVGYTAISKKDDFLTPFRRGKRNERKIIKGVILQAQMVSQIISAVVDGRPLIRVLPQWGSLIWIWVWSVAGGILVLLIRSPRQQIIVGGILLVALSGFCWFMFAKGYWIPLIPPAFCLVAICIALTIYTQSNLGNPT